MFIMNIILGSYLSYDFEGYNLSFGNNKSLGILVVFLYLKIDIEPADIITLGDHFRRSNELNARAEGYGGSHGAHRTRCDQLRKRTTGVSPRNEAQRKRRGRKAKNT